MSLKFNMADVNKKVFVTVGTTSFDGLVECVCREENVELLRRLGYTDVLCQIGRGTYEPPSTTSVQFYRYKDTIVGDIESADLIISHAGAGSVLEALAANKKLIVIVNEDLMDNHQVELAEALSAGQHLFYGTPSQLGSILQTKDLSTLVPFEKAQPEKFGAFLDKVMLVS